MRETEAYELNGQPVEVHRVTEDTAGEVTVVGMETRNVQSGDVLVATSRPDVWDVYPGDVFDAMGASRENRSDSMETLAPDTSDNDDTYDPGQHTVTDVLAYMETVDPAERTRIIDAERVGKNRAGIVNA